MQANNGLSNLHQSPLFRLGGGPVCRLESEQATYSTTLFRNMLAAQRLDYTFKGLQLLLHEGLRVRRCENLTLSHPPVSEHTPHLLW